MPLLPTKPDARNLPEFEQELRRVFSNGTRSGSTSGRAPAPTPRGPAQTRDQAGAARDWRFDRRPTSVAQAAQVAAPDLRRPDGDYAAHAVALHIPYLAELLTQQAGRRVVVAADGIPLEKGVAYLAGNGRHLTVERRGEQLLARQSDTAPEHYCKPAVDPMFRSIAKAVQGSCLGVVMTGMGSDGAAGAVALREHGNPVLVQDEASSVVWGMPGAVVTASAADAMYHADQLAAGILDWMGFAARGASR